VGQISADGPSVPQVGSFTKNRRFSKFLGDAVPGLGAQRDAVTEGILNPSIRVARTYRMALIKYDNELGPMSNSRARIPDLPPDDGIDELEKKVCGDWPPLRRDQA
jgi:hypothetical protein